jgi:hypothetical protein
MTCAPGHPTPGSVLAAVTATPSVVAPTLPLAPGYDVTCRLGEADELALIAAGFPAFCLWREATSYGIRYIAQGINLTARPYSVVTGDLTELRAALTAGQASEGIWHD